MIKIARWYCKTGWNTLGGRHKRFIVTPYRSNCGWRHGNELKRFSHLPRPRSTHWRLLLIDNPIWIIRFTIKPHPGTSATPSTRYIPRGTWRLSYQLPSAGDESSERLHSSPEYFPSRSQPAQRLSCASNHQRPCSISHTLRTGIFEKILRH